MTIHVASSPICTQVLPLFGYMYTYTCTCKVHVLYIVLIIYYLVLSPVNAYSIKTASLPPSLSPSLSLFLSPSLPPPSLPPSLPPLSLFPLVLNCLHFQLVTDLTQTWLKEEYHLSLLMKLILTGRLLVLILFFHYQPQLIVYTLK